MFGNNVTKLTSFSVSALLFLALSPLPRRLEPRLQHWRLVCLRHLYGIIQIYQKCSVKCLCVFEAIASSVVVWCGLSICTVGETECVEFRVWCRPRRTISPPFHRPNPICATRPGESCLRFRLRLELNLLVIWKSPFVNFKSKRTIFLLFVINGIVITTTVCLITGRYVLSNANVFVVDAHTDLEGVEHCLYGFCIQVPLWLTRMKNIDKIEPLIIRRYSQISF